MTETKKGTTVKEANLDKVNWSGKKKEKPAHKPDPMDMANTERWFVKHKKEAGASQHSVNAARKGFHDWNSELGKKKPLPESTDDSTKVLTMKDPLNKGGEQVNTKEKRKSEDERNKDRKGFGTWAEEYSLCLSEASWRDHFGWVSDKGKDHEGTGNEEMHQHILQKHGLRGAHYSDYKKAFKAGWSRYYNDNGHSLFHHDATAHKDKEVYHNALKHIQKHLESKPYHTRGVTLDIKTPSGKYEYQDHDNVKSAVHHLKKLRNASVSESMIARQYGKAYPLATESAPPGFEGTVKAMKKHKEITNPWALSWYLKNKGAKSHIKEDLSKTPHDWAGSTCTKCKKPNAQYTETRFHDDMDGLQHCNKCGHEVKRWNAKPNPRGGSRDISKKLKESIDPGDAVNASQVMKGIEAQKMADKGVDPNTISKQLGKIDKKYERLLGNK